MKPSFLGKASTSGCVWPLAIAYTDVNTITHQSRWCTYMIPMITRGEATKCCTIPGLSHLNLLLWMFVVPLPHCRECVIVLGSGAFLGRTTAPVNNQKPWGKPPEKSETKLSTNWATPQRHGLLLIARNSINYQPSQGLSVGRVHSPEITLNFSRAYSVHRKT